MTKCPICSTECTAKYGDSPYWQCPSCTCWHQDPMPPKTYIAEFEGDPTVMSDADRQINRELAERLFKNVMGGKPGKTLDIGCKLPVLASALGALGCDAHACDAAMPKGWSNDPDCARVTGHLTDVENDDQWKWLASFGKFDLVTCVHLFEHVENPLQFIQRVRSIVSDTGALFIRMPDHTVSGFERDLTPGHFQIHGHFHSIISILECCVQTRAFVVADSWPLDGAGQRDIVLKCVI